MGAGLGGEGSKGQGLDGDWPERAVKAARGRAQMGYGRAWR